jgi:hypothetical protein
MQLSVSLLNGNKFLTTGSHTGFAFNIGGTAVTVGTLPTGWANHGANTEPGFGNFSDGVNCTHGNTNTHSGCAGSNPWVGTLQFDVTRASGLTYSDFIANNDGIFFAVDIISGTTGLTGLVASNSTQTTTPEPSTMGMVGSGLLLGFFQLRRRFIKA